ncbi:MAG: hypothetical protein ACREPA_12060 [Candidatus Dormibacteraceae bacterium]
MLARGPGGWLGFAWRREELVGTVEGYRPAVPEPIYSLAQLRAHHLLTRLFLLHLRGRSPAPGPAAGPSLRIGAAVADVALCLTLSRVLRLRSRGSLILTAGYHLAGWSLAGRTPAGAATGQRVVAVDGSRMTPGQAAIRLAACPFAWVTRRGLHDEVAETEVVGNP